MDRKQKLTIPEMLNKLDELYAKEEEIIKQMNNLKIHYLQLQDDKEFLQNMIMYRSNQINRQKGRF